MIIAKSVPLTRPKTTTKAQRWICVCGGVWEGVNFSLPTDDRQDTDTEWHDKWFSSTKAFVTQLKRVMWVDLLAWWLVTPENSQGMGWAVSASLSDLSTGWAEPALCFGSIDSRNLHFNHTTGWGENFVPKTKNDGRRQSVHEETAHDRPKRIKHGQNWMKAHTHRT